MLRFIIRRKISDGYNGLQSEGLETLDANCQELEHALLSGGSSQHGYDCRELVGVEVLPASEPASTSQQVAPAPGPRPVTPLACPKCSALWLLWPAEQTGLTDGKDTLNCRSRRWCSYCETAGVDQLMTLGKLSERHQVEVDDEPVTAVPATQAPNFRAKS